MLKSGDALVWYTTVRTNRTGAAPVFNSNEPISTRLGGAAQEATHRPRGRTAERRERMVKVCLRNKRRRPRRPLYMQGARVRG